MTKAEACLWKFALAKKQMLNYSFRRQRPVGNYIVDFICLPLRLIVEVDGYSHQVQEIEIHNKKRQSELEKMGFTVIRFTDSEVLTQMDAVRDQIAHWVEKLGKQ